ncbi:MAG: hypothetical protein HC944_00010 [Nanoarchaeota archaeon]|nr:hypothetical protein [Nanoarchaeota archaeon]
MTLQKIKSIRTLVLLSTSIFAISILIGFIIYSCGFQHIVIIYDLKSYGQSLNPEFCDGLIQRINIFNADCEPQVEIFDCG